jgi:hypothetical protein
MSTTPNRYVLSVAELLHRRSAETENIVESLFACPGGMFCAGTTEGLAATG